MRRSVDPFSHVLRVSDHVICRQAPDRGLPSPDAVLFLDLSPEAAAKRGGFGNERYEKAAMQQEV